MTRSRSWLHTAFLLSSLVLLPLNTGRATADEPADSTGVPDYPEKISAKTTWETVASLPGTIVYLPVHGVFWTLERSYSFLFDEKAWERLKRLLTSEDGRFGARPLANSLNGFGARVFLYDAILNSKMNFTTQLSAWPQANANLTMAWPKNRLLPGSITFGVEYDRRLQKKFWGTGPDTRKSGATDFSTRDFFVRSVYENRLRGLLRFGAEFNYHRARVEAGENDELPDTPDSLAGVGELAHYLEAATFVRFSAVDNEGSPTRGNRTLLRLAYNQSIDKLKFSNLSVSATSRQFYELFHRRTISLQLGSDWRIKTGDAIAFYNLASLGGEQIMRGFDRDRYRDKGSAYAVLSYNFPVWKVIDGILFYERGRVFGDLDDLSFKNWRTSYGGGLNFWTKNGKVFQLFGAHSRENAVRIVFSLNVGI